MSRSSFLTFAVAVSLFAPAPASGEAPLAADPIAFFEGRTVGEGRLSAMMRKTRGVTVSSVGRVEPDGTLVVDQIVGEEGKPPRDRSWRIRAVSPGRYEGALTDATGPVTGTLTGDRLQLDFAIKGGLTVRQSLTFTADRMTAQNRMVVRKWGMKVATLEETIRKLEPTATAH